MDPLALLREYCVTGRLDNVVRNGTRIDFDELYSFESSTLTRFRSRGGHYTLGAVFFFLKNRTLGYGQYFQEAKKENLDTVAVVDKKSLTEFLEGRIETCAQIDTAMPNLPAGAGTKRTTPAGEEREATSDKRKMQKTEHSAAEEGAVSDVLPHNPDAWSIDQIYAQEKETFRPADCMRTFQNFTTVLKVANLLMTEQPTPRAVAGGEAGMKPKGPLKPIILVPHGMTAVVSMYNVKEFLEKGRYVFPSEIYRSNPLREVRTVVTRYFERDPPVRYVVAEKLPNKDDKETWRRVVAVVVSGKAHQFKDYPFEGCDKGEVYDLLHNQVQGFYFQYHDDDFRESEAARWKVKLLSVHRYHRHGDNLLMQQFWRELDKFMEEKKQKKLFKY